MVLDDFFVYILTNHGVMAYYLVEELYMPHALSYSMRIFQDTLGTYQTHKIWTHVASSPGSTIRTLVTWENRALLKIDR